MALLTWLLDKAQPTQGLKRRANNEATLCVETYRGARAQISCLSVGV